MSKKKILSLGLLIVLFLLAAIIVIKNVAAPEKAQQSEKENTEVQKEPFLETDKPTAKIKLDKTVYDMFDEFETYLIMGTDSSGNENASGDSYRGSMADFILLFIINKTSDTYSCLQINRDTMTEVQLLDRKGKGEATANIQLCTAHWYGGTKEQSCENTVTAVSKLLGGLEINGYYALSMEKIAKLNHLVGGVEVTIQDDFSKVDDTMKLGSTMVLTDEQAYTYVHDRYNVGDEANLSRMARQREYMKSLFTKVQQKTKEKSGYINTIYKGLKQDATTDMKGKTISKLTNRISKGTYLGMHTLEGQASTGKALGDGIDHVEYRVNDQEKISVLTEIYGLQEGKEKDE